MINETMSLFDAIHKPAGYPPFPRPTRVRRSRGDRIESRDPRPQWRQSPAVALSRDSGGRDQAPTGPQWYLSAWQAATAAMETLSQPYRHGAELAHQMATVPVLILACMEHGEAGAGPGPITRGASIYPAVQNLMLAARALGLGTVLTTLHTQYENEIKTLLNIPASVETAALIPMGYPAEGTRFGQARRKSLTEVVFHDRWDR